MREKSYDVVIVGSGAGGGAVAKELAPLAAAGKKIAVLEWGPKLEESEYTGREMEMAKKLYVDSGGFITAERTMTLAFGRAYGGSTVVYTGTSAARSWATGSSSSRSTSRGARAPRCATSAARTPPSRERTACSSRAPRRRGSRW